MSANRYVVVRSDLITGHVDVLGSGMTFSTPELAAEFGTWQAELPGCEITVCELVQVDGLLDCGCPRDIVRDEGHQLGCDERDEVTS